MKVDITAEPVHMVINGVEVTMPANAKINLKTLLHDGVRLDGRMLSLMKGPIHWSGEIEVDATRSSR